MVSIPAEKNVLNSSIKSSAVYLFFCFSYNLDADFLSLSSLSTPLMLSLDRPNFLIIYN